MKSMFRKKIITFFIVSVGCCIFFILFFLIKKDNFIVCKEVSDGYELILYSKSKDVVFSGIYPREPGINKIEENIVEISISTGSPARYVFYFDIENSEISDVFFNPIQFENEYIAYMEDGKLILTDIFKRDKLYKEIVRDFTKTANPMSTIVNIKLIDNENIILEYYIGEDYTQVSETIPIN